MNSEFEDIFIPDEEYEFKKAWVKEHIVDGMDWREGSMHVRVYNEINFKLGIVEKIERTRERISVSSAKELIKLLYILDYGIKQTTYWLWKWGFPGITIQLVQKHIRTHRRFWNEEKERWMKELNEIKDSLFQKLKADVMEEEKKLTEQLLKDLATLREELANINIIESPSKYKKTLGLITILEKKVKDSHGIDQLREQYIESAAEVATYRGKKEVDKEFSSIPVDALPQAQESKPALIQ